MELNICHLYPDLLNLYGDRGNVICLHKRTLWRGITCNIDLVTVDDKLDASKYDLFFMGGGQDFDQSVLLQDLQGQKGRELRAAVADEKVFLAICGGYQILGNYYIAQDGTQYDFLGAMDVYTVAGQKRMIGNYMFTCEDLPGQQIVGFENHAGKTYLGEGVQPLGKVLTGCGNNGEDGMEGARYKNVFATYSHGCLLPKNPELADLLIRKALERKDPQFTLAPMYDTFAQHAHQQMVHRLQGANAS